MRAGKLRKRVSIQTKRLTANSYNEPVESWATTATVWGELTPLLTGMREGFAQAADQVVARVAYQCRMRAVALSPAANRLVVEGRTFEITGVTDPDGRAAETIVFCYELQG